MRAAHQTTSMVIAAALALSVAGCSDDSTTDGLSTTKPTSVSTTTAAPRPTPTGAERPSADNPLGVDWAKKPPFTGPAAKKFGPANVMAAYQHAVTFSMEQGYSNLMAKGYDARPVEFSIVRPYLTPGAQKLWDADVKAALAKDKVGGARVSALTNWNLEGDQQAYKFRDGQVIFATDFQFSKATTSVQRIGAEDHLLIRFRVSRSIRLMKDGKPVLYPMRKDITYRMIPNGLKDIPWLISGWDIQPIDPGATTADPMGTSS